MIITEETAVELIRQHEGTCWSLAERCGRGLKRHDLEDVAAAVRSRLFRSAQTYDPALSLEFSTYSHRAARSAAIRTARLLRARGVGVPARYDVKGVPRMHQASTLGRTGPKAAGFLETFRAPAAEEPFEVPADFWARVVDALPARWGECVLLRFRDGLMFHEIAERMQVTRQRACQMVAGGLKRLRESGRFNSFCEGAA